MKLLFDENLSPRLVIRLASTYGGSIHIRNVGLKAQEDHRIWNYARTEGFAIVSKDTDFRERGYVDGFPPKVIWLDVGNETIADLLERESARVELFGRDAEASVLILSIGHDGV